MGLAINAGMTKYMLPTIADVPRMGSQNTANSYFFDVVKKFKYLGTANNTKRINIQRLRWFGHVVRWMQTLLREECLMRWSAVIGGRDDRIHIGKTRLKRP